MGEILKEGVCMSLVGKDPICIYMYIRILYVYVINSVNSSMIFSPIVSTFDIATSLTGMAHWYFIGRLSHCGCRQYSKPNGLIFVFAYALKDSKKK